MLDHCGIDKRQRPAGETFTYITFIEQLTGRQIQWVRLGGVVLRRFAGVTPPALVGSDASGHGLRVGAHPQGLPKPSSPGRFEIVSTIGPDKDRF